MRTLFIFFLLTIAMSSYGQGTITMKKGFGTRFFYEGQPVKPRQVLELMRSDEEAYPVFQKAMGNYNAGSVLGFVGGFLVGWPVGTAIGGGDPNWGLAAGGAAIILCSIPLSVAFNKHAETAVSIYNKEPIAFRPMFSVSPYGLGARLTVRIP